jgi:hypothetical protein
LEIESELDKKSTGKYSSTFPVALLLDDYDNVDDDDDEVKVKLSLYLIN